MDPITLIMFGLIAVLIFFMFRNGKKRQQAAQELQNSLRPGAEIMLQSGIFGTIESIDEESNRATVHSGTSSIVVHRSAITQVLTPSGAPATEDSSELAPDDDPNFNERVGSDQAEIIVEETEIEITELDAKNDDEGDSPKPQA